MTLKKQLLGMAVLILLVFSAQAFSQTSGSISGSVTDESGGALPGATVTITNDATGLTQKALTNSAGVYSQPGLPGGAYKVTAEMTGFQTLTKTEVTIAPAAQFKLNFTMKIAQRTELIEVSAKAENLLLESSSSVGVVLPEEKLTELPLVSSNVLDLIRVMGGVNMTDSPTFGADRTTFAGISAANVNLQRDGVTVNDVRWATGLSSPVYLNPELIGEFKLVIAPVDAEMGRGSGQVQVVTRSGANDLHGSGVWNIQNTALDSNQWSSGLTSTPVNWRNQEEYTISVGGPIIKNKTFFFASWDQQISRIREHNTNPQVLTPCARKGIFRYFEGYANGNFQTVPAAQSSFNTRTNPLTRAVVDSSGIPKIGPNPDGTTSVVPTYMSQLMPGEVNHVGLAPQLMATSVFGPLKQAIPASDYNCDAVQLGADGYPTDAWVNYGTGNAYDAPRVRDITGSVQKFLSYTPTGPNNYDVGDGLNYGGYRWTRSNNGIDNVYGLGEGPNRKQFSVRIDHNFNAAHRLSGSYSWETDNGEDAQPMWPENSYGGVITRDPRSFSVNLTSTLKPTLLNEFRWGYSRTESFVVSPLYNDVSGGGDKLRQLYKDIYDPTQIPGYNADVPILMGLGSTYQIYGGSNPYGSGRGNFGTYWGGKDPRMIFADTLTWTRGKHSFKFGGEAQMTQSWQEGNGSVSFTDSNLSFPYARGGASVNAPNQGFYRTSAGAGIWTLPYSAGSGSYNIVSGIHNLLNIQSGSLSSIGQWFFINSPDQLVYNDVGKGEAEQITDYRQNQFNFFFKDDWKVTDNLTLNLGVRYEWYGVPYLKNGMTPGLAGGAMAGFARSGSTFEDWMKVPAFTPRNLGGSAANIQYKGTDAAIAYVGPDSSNPDMQLYNDDWNNWGPAVGFAYQLPWWGKGKTTIRGGYQTSFLTLGRATVFNAPGSVRDYNFNGSNLTGADAYLNLEDLPKFVPVPIPAQMKTPAASPVIPVYQRQVGTTLYNPELATPYVHNITMSLTRNIGSALTVDVRYIGTLSRKQTGSVNLNTANYLENGLKEMLDCARYDTAAYCGLIRSGETQTQSQKLDSMFWGISLANPSFGYGPVGTTRGTTYQSGALHMRANTTMQGNLANGNYAGVAGSLATMNINPVWNPGLPVPEAYTAGQVLRYNEFPENFIYTSPQFTGVTFNGNLNHANYHSMQAQVTLRPWNGLSLSGTYTWSRNLGMLGYIDPRNRDDDYGLLNTHRSHAFTSYGTYDLPFGPNRQIASGVNPGTWGRVIGGWQLSWILTAQSGRPGNTPTTTGMWGTGRMDYMGSTPYDTKAGHVTWPILGTKESPIPSDRYGSYFDNKLVLVDDPQCATLTTNQGLRSLCTINAMRDADTGQILFQNPLPGTRGNWDTGMFTTPMTWNTDMALTKVVRITEGKSFQLRIDATNIFNHPFPSYGSFGSAGSRVVAPGDGTNITLMDLSSANFFNRNAGFLDSKVGARTFQAKVRFDF